MTLKRISKDDKLHRAMSCRCQYFLLSFYLEILLNIRYFQTFRFRLSVFASIQEANIISLRFDHFYATYLLIQLLSRKPE